MYRILHDLIFWYPFQPFRRLVCLVTRHDWSVVLVIENDEEETIAYKEQVCTRCLKHKYVEYENENSCSQ